VVSLLLAMFIVCVGVVLTATPAAGQATSTGTVSGQVNDQQGRPVVGADVKLTDTSINTSRSTASNDTGRFIFVNVAPGNFNLSITKEGFKIAKFVDQKVTIGLTLNLTVVLEVGSNLTTVEVKAGAGAEMQTNNATTGTTLSGQTLLMLPNLGRDVTTLLIAQPAVSPQGYSAGANYDQNLYQLDGGQNSNDMDGSMSIYTPSSGSVTPQSTGGAPSGVMPTPVESIEEFKVSTANQTADFNGAGGAQVQLATKRGTDTWHGSAYEYYLGSYFGANTWDNDRTGTAKPKNHQNRFGFAAGGPVLPKFLGGKTYFFANYEGLRYPLSTTLEKLVPSVLFKQGILQAAVNGVVQQFNFNPANGPLAICSGGPCDPRGIGINPTISKVWSFMPNPNDMTLGDTNVNPAGTCLNVCGYKANELLPLHSNFGTVRVDHDFGAKWHWMSSYRVYEFLRTPTGVQDDIGGFFAGDTKGVPTALGSRPIKPTFLVTGMTTNITPNLTNDFHFSYLRNYWSWSTHLAPPQVSGIPGAIEISPGTGAAESFQSLDPYNVNTQAIRQRFWDGHDSYYRDDLSLIHGSHLWQIGGLIQHNWDFHTRDDNGSGTLNNPVFLVGSEAGVSIPAAYQPAGLSSAASRWNGAYQDLLGISGAQVAYTRAGSNLALQALGTDAFDQSTILTYNLYMSDSWHMKPTFTMTYGIGYLVETPPHETASKQITLVDSAGNQIGLVSYLAQRQAMALQGQVFNPPIGYSLVSNVGTGLKYPYHFFYGGLSPRAAVAWTPNFDSGLLGHMFGHGKTVIRGGYGRIYSRQNGVDLVLVPLLGVGLIQAVKCPGATIAGVCSGSGNADPTNAFRIGVDPNPGNLYTQGVSNTLPQPFFPGITQVNGVTSARASDTLVLDPNFKPAHSDEFTFTIQRDLGHNMILEVGYIGRHMADEYMNINLDQIPYMLTLGGQQFQNAYANVEKALGCATSIAACGASVPAPLLPGKVPNPAYGNFINAIASQPFFTAALPASYCAGTFSNGTGSYANCTAALIDKEGPDGTQNLTTQSLYSLWTHIAGKAPGSVFANSLIGQNQATSVQMSGAFGHGNYNGLFVSLQSRNWHGLTLNTNFTWSRSMGTQFYAQANNGINPNNGYDFKNWGSYGPQPYDLKFVYNLQGLYQLPFYKNQPGIVGRLLGGWSIAPFLTMRSGFPIIVYTDGNITDETFGQGNPNSGNLGTNALLTSAYTAGSSRLNGVTVAANPQGVGLSVNATGTSLFANPVAVYNQFRPYILGLDNVNGASGGGGGPLRGLSYWNLDMTASKDYKFTERFGMTFVAQISNLFNHPQLGDPYLDLQDPGDFGHLGGQINSPRQMEFGLRFHF
jgi:hypothetical protein